MKFEASYGTWTIISTVLVVAIFAVLIASDLWGDALTATPVMPILLAVAIFVMGFSFALSVTHYEITETELIIHKRLGKSVYKRAQIETVQPLDRRLLRYAIRTFGIGGVFGYYGEFYSGKLGSMTWYRTRLDNPVLIKTTTKKIVLSPDEPQKFIAALQP